ncbi:MAG: tetratricopeptide repeat protein [Rhizobiaceae bacterium]
MRQDLKLSKTNNALFAACFLMLPAPALAAEAKADRQSVRYEKPIEGPEFPSPVALENQAGEVDQGDVAKSDHADHAFGAYQRGFYLTAFELALPRAESGDPAAQTLIAELYWNGLGVAQDREKAMDWYKFAAEAGGRDAQFIYARSLLRGEGIKADPKRGEEMMRKAADAGHHSAQFALADLMVKRRPTFTSFKQAVPYFESAAKGGNAEAAFALASIYAEAKGVLYTDEEKAREWLHKAARAGLDAAQIEYGVWLADGRGGKKDLKQARYWITRAAARGNVVAQNRLARIHAFSDPINADLIKASAWHILAQRAGVNDPELDRMFQDLSDIDKKRSIEAANQLSRLMRPRSSG